MLAILTVNSLADTHINTDGVLTIREAVEVVQQGNTNGLDSTTIANQISGTLGNNDTIKFASSVDGGIVTLNLNFGQISFSKSLTIDASDRSSISINGNDPTPGRTRDGIRIFNITDPTGGAAPPLVTLIGLTLTQSDTEDEGGAIRSAARLIIRDCVIVQNEADKGGGIFAEVAAGTTQREVLTIENSVIHNNDADTGGGVAIVSGSSGAPTSDTVVITGTTISDNKAGFGGGVHAKLYGATVSIAASTLVLNETPSGTGGGVFAELDDGTSLIVSGSLLEENDATSGAGLYAELNNESTLRVEATTFYDNEATSDGGGVYASVNDATVEVIGSVFLQNDANSAGGGLFAESFNASSVLIEQTSFELNTASHGGGVFVDTSSASVEFNGSVFLNNDVTGSGGGIHAVLNNGATVEIINSSVDSNDADFGGGGVFGSITEDADALLEIRESQITGNIATDGGGVRVDMPGFGHFQANGSVFNMHRSLVDGNRATNSGGGILTAIGAGGQATINESVITGNDAGIALLGSGDIPNAGGGMYAYLWTDLTAAKLTISGTEISANSAGQHGGGLALCTKREATSEEITELSVYNTTISGNQALYATMYDGPSTGGGVHLEIFHDELQKLDARFQNVTITNNTAHEGGGVWSYVPTPFESSHNDVRLTNSIISGNLNFDDEADNFYGSIHAAATGFNLFGHQTSVKANTFYDHLTKDEIFFNDLGSGNLNNGGTNDPRLEPLKDNGGPTRTHRPQIGSDAIDAGSNALAIIPFTDVPPSTGTQLTTDQRGAGFERIYDLASEPNDPNETVDIGAYEIGTPKIYDVVIRNNDPEFSHTYSFAEVLEERPDSGTQLEAVLVLDASEITVRFSEPMNLDSNSGIHFQLIALSTVAGAPQPSDFDYAVAEAAATMKFDTTNLPAAVQFLLTVDDVITDLYGTALDGNWKNPASVDTMNPLQSEFPSGDGTPGGDFEFVFTSIMPNSDLENVDNNVENNELTVLLDNWGAFVDPFTNGDFNGSGQVENSDLTMLLDLWGTNLRNLKILRSADNDWNVDMDDYNNAPDVDGDGQANTAEDKILVEEQLGLDISDSIAFDP